VSLACPPFGAAGGTYSKIHSGQHYLSINFDFLLPPAATPLFSRMREYYLYEKTMDFLYFGKTKFMLLCNLM